jgi:hypothetical protein
MSKHIEVERRLVPTLKQFGFVLENVEEAINPNLNPFTNKKEQSWNVKQSQDFPLAVDSSRDSRSPTTSLDGYANEDNADVRVVRHVDRLVLGQEDPLLVPLPIADDRNENPDYEIWKDI